MDQSTSFSTPSPLWRRLLLGMGVSLISGWALLGLLTMTRNLDLLDHTVNPLLWGTLVSLLVSAGYICFCLPAGHRPHREHGAAALSYGLLLEICTWLVLTLNLQPVFLGRPPLWQAADALATLPALTFCLLQGGLFGLLYPPLFRLLEQPLRLTSPEHTLPPIQTRIVILGGGYAGVAAAETLEEEFARDLRVDIRLVSSTNFLLHTPLLSEVAASAVNAQHISPPLRSTFRRVQVVQATVERVDVAERMVYLAGVGQDHERQLPFDQLVVALGAEPHFFGNAGLEANSFTLKSLEDAVRLRAHIIHCFERADQATDPTAQQRLLTFVVAGGGFAGVELMGGLNDFTRGIAAYYPNVNPDAIRMVLIHSGETILPELSVALGQYAQEKLAERGVEFRLKTRVTGAEPGRVRMGDDAIATDTFVWTAGNRPNAVLAQLGLPLTPRGQIAVNEQLAVPSLPGIWAAGDCAQIPDKASRTGFAPPTAQHAQREGKLIGHNIAATLRNQPLNAFDFKTLGSLSALGHQLAVAEIFGYRFSGLLAWLMWRTIYLAKLPTLEKRIRVGLDWLLDLFFPPDIVQTLAVAPPEATKQQQVEDR